LRLDPAWLEATLKKRITGIDWGIARRDVQRFLPLREQETLELWGRDFFLHQLAILMQTLTS